MRFGNLSLPEHLLGRFVAEGRLYRHGGPIFLDHIKRSIGYRHLGIGVNRSREEKLCVGLGDDLSPAASGKFVHKTCTEGCLEIRSITFIGEEDDTDRFPSRGQATFIVPDMAITTARDKSADCGEKKESSQPSGTRISSSGKPPHGLSHHDINELAGDDDNFLYVLPLDKRFDP